MNLLNKAAFMAESKGTLPTAVGFAAGLCPCKSDQGRTHSNELDAKWPRPFSASGLVSSLPCCLLLLPPPFLPKSTQLKAVRKCKLKAGRVCECEQGVKKI